MADKRILMIFDFNSIQFGNKKYRASNHSNVVRLLESRGILSTYHLHRKQTQGMEEHATLYMYRHNNKPYHVDYCFVSAEIAGKLKTIEIGEYDLWTKNSDHVPVIMTFDEI